MNQLLKIGLTNFIANNKTTFKFSIEKETVVLTFDQNGKQESIRFVAGVDYKVSDIAKLL